MLDAARPLRRLLGTAVSDGVDLAERAAFWSAVALPCLHVPLLAVVGFDDSTAPVLAVLWALHALTLLAGARYDPAGA